MSEFDIEDDIPTPAQTAQKRAMELVIRDHAREAWGNLRGIDQLDSKKAEEILMAGMQKLLAAVKSTKVESVSERHNALFQVGKRLRAVVMELWGETGSNGEAHLGSQKTCRLCKGLKSSHKPECPVKVALVAAKNVGLGGD